MIISITGVIFLILYDWSESSWQKLNDRQSRVTLDIGMGPNSRLCCRAFTTINDKYPPLDPYDPVSQDMPNDMS